jgi:hypothetical protein
MNQRIAHAQPCFEGLLQGDGVGPALTQQGQSGGFHELPPGRRIAKGGVGQPAVVLEQPIEKSGPSVRVAQPQQVGQPVADGPQPL